MSDLSILEIAYATGESIDVDEHAERIYELLEKFGYDRDALNDLRDAFTDGEAEFGGRAAGLLFITEEIARLSPAVTFYARGTGEEFRDTWIREFEDGKAVFAAGP
jgi:hypothetical protein